jgi:ParB/RepB/Spo0J family partition protein
MSHEVKAIKVSSIRISDGALRKPDTSDVKFAELRDSIRDNGVLDAVKVREYADPTNSGLEYELIDGSHRLAAVSELGYETIPARVMVCSSEEALFIQIASNEHRKATKPAEYAQGLTRILLANPTMSLDMLAQKLNKSAVWLTNIYSLNKIKNQGILDMINSGKISLTNAIELVRFSTDDDRELHLEQAQIQTAAEFKMTVTEALKEIRRISKEGKDQAGPEVFKPVPTLRKKEEILQAVETAPNADFAAGLKYALSLDASTVEQKRVEWETAKKEAADKAAKLAGERAEKKAAKLSAELAQAQKAAEAARA